MAARGILYLLIFQQLGQLVRWSWGYHVLLAPAEKYDDDEDIEGGRYRDEPELISTMDGEDDGNSSNSSQFGGRTPVTNAGYVGSFPPDDEAPTKPPGLVLPTPTNGNYLPDNNITSFPSIRTPTPLDEQNIPDGIRGVLPRAAIRGRRATNHFSKKCVNAAKRTFVTLPTPVQSGLTKLSSAISRFGAGLWEFMNPPLWAMLIAVIVASIPSLQRLFFEDGSFIANSVTSAIAQSGGVAVPLILVVLGANLARNTLPVAANDPESEENKIGGKLLVASLISRMLLPTLIMAPILALVAKYIPVSIVDDPIFVIVCFLLTGAPSALQLAQICQINGVYEGVMSKLLFQSYVIWYVGRFGYFCMDLQSHLCIDLQHYTLYTVCKSTDQY